MIAENALSPHCHYFESELLKCVSHLHWRWHTMKIQITRQPALCLLAHWISFCADDRLQLIHENGNSCAFSSKRQWTFHNDESSCIGSVLSRYTTFTTALMLIAWCFCLLSMHSTDFNLDVWIECQLDALVWMVNVYVVRYIICAHGLLYGLCLYDTTVAQQRPKSRERILWISLTFPYEPRTFSPTIIIITFILCDCRVLAGIHVVCMEPFWL